jgi:hypothetical protein
LRNIVGGGINDFCFTGPVTGDKYGLAGVGTNGGGGLLINGSCGAGTLNGAGIMGGDGKFVCSASTVETAAANNKHTANLMFPTYLPMPRLSSPRNADIPSLANTPAPTAHHQRDHSPKISPAPIVPPPPRPA